MSLLSWPWRVAEVPDEVWLDPDLPRFAEVLPYAQHDPVTGLYGMPDGPRGDAVGCLLEALPQVGVSEQLENALQELPGMLPPGACLQVVLYADADVRTTLARYCNLRPGEGATATGRASGVYRHLARRRYAHLAGLGGELAPCDHRLFFSVSMAGSLDDHVTVAAMAELQQSFRAVLAGCAIKTKVAPPAVLVNLIGGILNPAHPGRRQLPHDPQRLLAGQCLLRDTEIGVGTGALTVRGDGQEHALASLWASTYPASMRLAGIPAVLGDPLRPNLRYRGPYLIALCVQALDPEDARMLVSLRAARATSNTRSVMAWLMPGQYARQRDDWRTCAEVLDAGGNLVHMAHHVTVRAPAAAIEEAVEAARSVWRAAGFTLGRCEYLQVQGLLATLPLALTPAAAADLRRLGWLGRKTTHNAAHGMPVVAEWKGTKNPALLLVGRRGQLMNLDLFDAEGNRNAIIAGASGSGKSVLLNEVATTSLGLGAQVWVLDIGRSYQLTCEYLGGEFIEFAPSSRMSLNPFSAVVDINADMRLLNPLFAQMIAPRGGLGDYQRARLEEALLATWAAHGPAANPTRVHAELLRLGAGDPRVADMAAMLVPFTARGVHGQWFDGPATVDFSADYAVLELEELQGRPELQVVVFLQLLFLVSQRMYGSRERRKLVIIDEAWDLMRGEHVAEFIEHGYRRSRKYNGAFLSASQSVADFYGNPAGRAAIANSDWMLLLAQKGEEVSQLVDRGQLDLDPGELAQVRSLRTVPGSHSEIFVRAAGMPGAVGRLTVDDHTQLLYSTRAEDRHAVALARGRGLALADAIAAVVRQRHGHAAA